MSKPIWQPEHAAQLKRLRQASGLDPIQLAKKHLITPTQIKQLEEGGDAAFYSGAIKYGIGRKLVTSLGEELIQTEPSLTAVPVQTEPMPSKDREPNKGATSPPSPNKAAVMRRLPWVYLISVLIVAMALMVFLLRTTAPPERRPLPLASIEPEKIEQDHESADVLTPPADAPPTELTAVKLSTEEIDGCAWAGEPIDLTPAQGTRPADYIYIVGISNSTLCWRDARQKTEKLRLRPNEAINLPGQPPFSVYSPDPDGFHLYYKGQLIRMKHNGTVHIILGSP